MKKPRSNGSKTTIVWLRKEGSKANKEDHSNGAPSSAGEGHEKDVVEETEPPTNGNTEDISDVDRATVTAVQCTDEQLEPIGLSCTAVGGFWMKRGFKHLMKNIFQGGNCM